MTAIHDAAVARKRRDDYQRLLDFINATNDATTDRNPT